MCNGRGGCELVERDGGRKFLLDGAHNIGGAESLRVALQSLFCVTESDGDFGHVAGQGLAGLICKILAPLAGRILLVHR